MKVGIITILKVNNYGAELQAFALQRKLEKLGFESEIIDYLYYKNWNFRDTKLSVPFVNQTLKQRIKYFAMYRLANFLLDEILPYFNNRIAVRLDRFKKFHLNHTKISKVYKSYNELYSEYLTYDAYVVGSDQVWNPSASSSIEPYFLTFSPKDKNKLSYASSFGVAKIEENLIPRYIALLNNINHISVREEQGIDLVKSFTGRDVTLVLDPTFLLNKEDWKEVMKLYSNMPSKYILIYQLSESSAIVELALTIAKEIKIPVYRICKRAIKEEQNLGVINILDAGPSEFLSLIFKASYLITNSFHGTAFSINFNIPFFSVISENKKNNSRIESILSILNLSERLILDNRPIKGIDFLTEIDFVTSNKILNAMRIASVDFLLSALNQ